MAFNPTGAQGSPLNVLGGWCTEMAPPALPEGVSPDNQDVGYLPGSVYSRPCTQKVFNPPLVSGATCVYSKSFVTATGDIKNLYLFSTGAFYVEDWTNSPGTASLLLTTTPGSLCKSVTAFGREWIAFSDGLHGTDIPYQYDGTNLYRVTQDGPGAPPTVTNLQLPAVQMASSGNTLTRYQNTVTAQTAAAHNLQVGYQAQISDVPDSNATTVNQTGISPLGSQTYNGSYWQQNGNEYRSFFNPGTAPLSAFQAIGFGFNIPSNATVLGVVIGFATISQSATTGYVAEVALWYSGAQEGTLKSPHTNITTTYTNQSYGGPADLWGASLTPAIVNDPSFGFAVSVTCDSIRCFLGIPFTCTVYYTLSGSGTVAQISSIVINNEVQPGRALVTTTEPHGLVPGVDVSIVGVEPATVANVSAAQWSSGTTTLTTDTSHNLKPGAVIQVGSVTTSTGSTSFSFNGTFTVQSVPAPNQISYQQAPITATDPDVINATGSTGSVTVSWPIPDNTPTPTYFEVESCPSPTTFYVAVSYSDGTWSTGSVGFIWEGTFYVTSVPSPTSFTYFQPGPNGATTAVGTVTPFGQMAPGLHLIAQAFLLADGTITAPSPFVSFIANGGQYPQFSDLAIGPSNVVGRIIICTGAQPDVPGEIPPFFYIPVPAQLEGQVVSTATVINDNTTTTAVLDFSDNTLYAATGVSILGNNLANQIVLDGALGFSYWDSRLTTYGQRNRIQNFVNMGMQGGYLPSSFLLPSGWNTSAVVGATLENALSGGLAFAGEVAWQTNLHQIGTISQSAYLDCSGDPIAEPNTLYMVRAWFNTFNLLGGATATFSLSSASTSFSATVTFTAAQMPTQAQGGGFIQGVLSAKTPQTIPSDLIFEYTNNMNSQSQGFLQVAEISLIDAEQPYLDDQGFTSYVNNPTGFDGDTGNIQPTEDTRKLMDFGLIRGTPYCLTQDPAGRLHEIIVSPTSEPSGWAWNEVAANCGSLSAFGLTTSQADDDSAAGGENWFAWPSEGGAMIFDGGYPTKISQEIQQAWSGQQLPGVSWPQINMAAATTISALNDPVERILYFFLPTGNATSPNRIYALYYKELNSAYAIANSPPFHPSLAGKLIATDNARKWSPWNLPMYGGARMYRTSSGKLDTVFYGGAFGNVYTLNPAKLSDDDFGVIAPYYVTHFFLDPEKAQMMQLTAARLLLAYITAYLSGTGQVTFSFLVNSLTNVWPLSVTRPLASSPNFDMELAGGNAMGNRIAVKMSFAPTSGNAVQFNLQRFQAWFKKAKLSIRGAAQ